MSCLSQERILPTFFPQFLEESVGAPHCVPPWEFDCDNGCDLRREEPVLPHSLAGAVGQGLLGSWLHQKLKNIYNSFCSEVKTLMFQAFVKKPFQLSTESPCWHKCAHKSVFWASISLNKSFSPCPFLFPVSLETA